MLEEENPFLEAALRYAEMGYHVFPCRPGKKRPITGHGFQNASTDPEQIRKWWKENPYANVAIHSTGILVVDVDGEANPWLAGEPEKAVDLAQGVVALTPRGGKHYIFKQPPGRSWPSTIGRLAPEVDTRSEGGYFLVAPSVFLGKAYGWLEGAELDGPLDTLPEPPGWLMEWLDRLTSESSPGLVLSSSDGIADGNPIPEGQRNGTLARIAGYLRRIGLGRDEILAALLKVNILRCKPPLPEAEVEKIAASISRYPPDQIAVATVENHWAQDRTRWPVPIEKLVEECPEMRRPVIEKLLREGETMNIISAPKIGKSWLVIDLALAVATGRHWLGEFKCEPGSVLIIDNELHKETSAKRIPEVMNIRGISNDDIRGRLFVENLRGQLQDLISLGPYFDRFEPGQFKMIILDAFYRFLPLKTDENDNGTMASLYNYLDRYADRLKCCFVLIHHTSKGNQSAKEVTDVGAGAGAQSRATDTHLVLRKHEEEDVVVLDATVRSWPPQPPLCLRWTYPVWEAERDLDPTLLKRDRPARKAKDDEAEPTGIGEKEFVEHYINEKPQSVQRIKERAYADGVSKRRVDELINLNEETGTIHAHRIGARKAMAYATVPPEKPKSRQERVREMLQEDPEMPLAEIAKEVGLTKRRVEQIREEADEIGAKSCAKSDAKSEAK